MVIISSKDIRELVGIVTSISMSKTIVIKVDNVKIHPLYKKRYVRSKKYYVHKEDDVKVLVWDTVKIRECRPMSKLKRFKLISVLKTQKE